MTGPPRQSDDGGDEQAQQREREEGGGEEGHEGDAGAGEEAEAGQHHDDAPRPPHEPPVQPEGADPSGAGKRPRTEGEGEQADERLQEERDHEGFPFGGRRRVSRRRGERV